MLKNLVVVSMAALLCACASNKSVDLYEVHKFNAPLYTGLRVETGESLYVQGEYINGEKIVIDVDQSMMIPGSMFIPFPIGIGVGDLYLTRITADWRYYCGEDGNVEASFPGLGSVIASGDCVGIRISTDKKDKEWVVDNSIYNSRYGRETVWSRSMAKEDLEKYNPIPADVLFKVKSLTTITFDGYYGKQLHFTWTEWAGNKNHSQDFIFDFDGNPTLVGIKGNLFTVVRADNTGLDYQWKRFNTLNRS